MTAKVLARITSPDRPRGPDVEMALSVPAEWIAEGATLEIELPRNLACAACSGGGCDACGRSGAVSLRGKKDPIELVEVTLPKLAVEEPASSPASRGLVVRIPERGGLPDLGSSLPRGNLMLSVSPSVEPSKGVTRLVPPPPPPETPSISEALRRSLSPASPGGRTRLGLLAAIVVAVIVAVIAWLWRR